MYIENTFSFSDFFLLQFFGLFVSESKSKLSSLLNSNFRYVHCQTFPKIDPLPVLCLCVELKSRFFWVASSSFLDLQLCKIVGSRNSTKLVTELVFGLTLFIFVKCCLCFERMSSVKFVRYSGTTGSPIIIQISPHLHNFLFLLHFILHNLLPKCQLNPSIYLNDPNLIVLFLVFDSCRNVCVVLYRK